MHTWTTPRRAPRIAAAAAVLLLAACGGGDETAKASGPPLPPGVSGLAANARLPMAPSTDRRCQPGSIRRIFRMAAEWEGFWQYGFAPDCPRPRLPADFDFARETAVIVAMGPRQSPADSIQVVGTRQSGDSVLIVVRRVTRQSRCAEAPVQTYPRDLVRIPAIKGPARFVEQHVKLPCPTP